jgi:hypothetical protein
MLRLTWAVSTTCIVLLIVASLATRRGGDWSNNTLGSSDTTTTKFVDFDKASTTLSIWREGGGGASTNEEWGHESRNTRPPSSEWHIHEYREQAIDDNSRRKVHTKDDTTWYPHKERDPVHSIDIIKITQLAATVEVTRTHTTTNQIGRGGMTIGRWKFILLVTIEWEACH